MTTTAPSHLGGRESAISLAIRLGLLWQAAFSVAMLRHYLRHSSSFYLTNITGAWPYVAQHLLWIGAFIALSTGSRKLARVLAGGGAFLAVVQIVSLADGGGPTSATVSAGGVAFIGLLPAIALLASGVAPAFRRRLDWLSAWVIVATVLPLFDDGVAELASGGMRIGSSELNGVVRAVWVGWVACILVLAWQGQGDRTSRGAALLSTTHLLAVELAWLASSVLAQFDVPGLGLRTFVPIWSLSRMLFLAAILAVVFLRPRSDASSLAGSR